MRDQSKVIFVLDGSRGIHLPSYFARHYADIVTCCFGGQKTQIEGIESSTALILANGPDEEFYWDCWDDVLSKLVVTVIDTKKSKEQVYRLHQVEGGDLFFIHENYKGELLDH